jgi:hypothetical protein
MIRICVAAMAAAFASACTMTPTVKTEVTTMSMREIREAGLECRQLIPIDSNIPRTICASDASWAAYDDSARRATDDLLAEGKKLGNAFGRP